MQPSRVGKFRQRQELLRTVCRRLRKHVAHLLSGGPPRKQAILLEEKCWPTRQGHLSALWNKKPRQHPQEGGFPPPGWAGKKGKPGFWNRESVVV